ncbi:hypothetical protein FB451DRAFT_9882 [Mycena latifolia]|nr:hypothetical protein FB451DRAFT_9882 [Mycena latifolia]
MLCATTSVPRVFPRLLSRQLSRMQNIDNSSRPRRGVDLDVVEDSEPEREALRQSQKLERKRKKLTAIYPLELATMAEKPGPSKVIEISDGSVSASPVASSVKPTLPSPSTISVIEISDSSVSMSEPHDVRNKDIVSLPSSLSNKEKIVGDATDMDILSLYPHVAATSAAPSDLDHSDDEEIVPMLGLAHFAFTNPRPVHHRNFSSSAGSHSNNDTQAKAPAKPAARGSSNRTARDFSEPELRKLVKCVSCDIAWTARKSGPQKLLHIRTCAKKNGLTDDTVKILIKREIDSAPNDAGPSKHKGKVLVDAPTTAPTLLEDVVREAAPRRKGKRKETVDALKSVSETRDTILGRARMLLASGPSSEGHSFVAQTQAFTSTALTTAPEPTQAFRPSRLGQQQGSKLSLLREQDSDGEPDLPPATQAFAPSKLGTRPAAGTSGGWGYESESEREPSSSASDVDAFTARRSNKSLDLPPSPFSSSVKEVAPRLSPKATRNRNVAVLPSPAQPESDEWEDDAYVQFDPELNKEPVLEALSPTQQKPKKTTRGGQSTKSPKSKRRAATLAKTDDQAPPPTTPKRNRKKAEDEYDENWELGLREKIMKDRDLHLRILRYEPINFDVFLRLATAGETAGGRLKFKLRAFLDKQAINFYGGETGRAGRR